MNNTKYLTDLTEAEIEPIKSCLHIQRASKWPLSIILNAIFYVCREGIKWRALPKDMKIPWQTVYWYFAKWTKTGAWQAVNETLVMIRRQRASQKALPSIMVIDAQTAKNTATSTSYIGVDGGKKIKGRKRMKLVDSAGNLFAVKVFEANRHEGAVALKWWRSELLFNPVFEHVTLIRADQQYGGKFTKGLKKLADITVQTTHEPIRKARNSQMLLHKGRWVVERTNAWDDNSRRLSKDYERLPWHEEAFCLISSITRMLYNKTTLN